MNNKDSYNIEAYLDKIPNLEQVKECMKIYKANKQRKYNSWNEICKWCFGISQIKGWTKYKLIFGTLTFEDKVIENTNKTTRRRYVQRYLSEHTIHYQANIDFGKKNEREHYHFIAMTKDNLDSKSWQYGITWFNNIKFSRKELKKVRNYLLKLNNHSYKESTKQARIIRDRNDDKLDSLIENLYEEEFRKFKMILNAKE